MIRSDATAAIGICKRQGFGKVRHLVIADLWVQQLVRHRRCRLDKWLGPQNPADLMTKHFSRAEIEKYWRLLGMARLEGRAELCPIRAGTSPIVQPTEWDDELMEVDRAAHAQIAGMGNLSSSQGSS